MGYRVLCELVQHMWTSFVLACMHPWVIIGLLCYYFYFYFYYYYITGIYAEFVEPPNWGGGARWLTCGTKVQRPKYIDFAFWL